MWQIRTIGLIVLFGASVAAGPCDRLTGESAEEDADDTDSMVCDDFDVTCNHSLAVEILLPGDDTFLEGNYTFTVIAPDESEYSVDCMLYSAVDGFVCTGGNTDVLNAVLDEVDAGTAVLQVAGAPPYCTVQVDWNGYPVGEETLAPEYDITYPNGEGCEPACYNGDDAMAILLR